MTIEEPQTKDDAIDMNKQADFIFHNLGNNPIPIPTGDRSETPPVKFETDYGLLHKSMDIATLEHFKRHNYYNVGIASTTGPIWRGRNKGLNFFGIDADTKEAYELICTYKNKLLTIQELNKYGVFVQSHGTNDNSFHFYLITDKIFPNVLPNKLGIEVKGVGSWINMFGKHHEDGTYWKFLGQDPIVLGEYYNWHIRTDFMQHIFDILDESGVQYSNGKTNYNPVTRNEGKIPNGQRHGNLLSQANSLIARLHKTTNKETIRKYFELYNQEECVEPLGSKEGPEQQKELKELKDIFNDSWDERTKDNGNGEANKEETQQENISFEDWQTELNEKYQNLRIVSNDNLPGLWASLEFELSVKDILNIKDCTLPFAGILLGPPGAKKTLGLQLFRKVPNTFYTDNFSARSFVSHSTTVKKEDLPSIDMLPRMKNNFFLTPELAPIFGKKDEDLMEILSMITRILDGHGFESDTGAHGHRGYPEDIMFTWVGAAVEIPYKVHKYLGARGAKLYFYRLPLIEKSDDEYMDEMSEDDFNVRTKIVQDALLDYLNSFNRCPEGTKTDNLIKITWNAGKEDKETLGIILRLAKLLAHFRAVVSTWGKDEDYGHAFATIEDPTRAMIQLRNLARGHALSQGRNYITTEDITIIIETVFSTASLARVRIFELLLEYKGKLTTSKIVESLNISDDTARRTMTELQAIGLVDIEEVQGDHGGEPQKQIKLVEKFKWFLDKEFKILKDSHSAQKQPCVCVNQNYNYERSIVLNSILPRIVEHTTFLMRSGENPIVLQFLHDSRDVRDAKTENNILENDDITSDILETENNKSETTSHTSQESHSNPPNVKCPECDHENEPFNMKIHYQNTGHGDYKEPQVRGGA